jgi:hypothetical protein
VLLEVRLDLPMQDRDLFVERGQDRDLCAHQDGIGRAHRSRLAQVLGA